MHVRAMGRDAVLKYELHLVYLQSDASGVSCVAQGRPGWSNRIRIPTTITQSMPCKTLGKDDALNE